MYCCFNREPHLVWIMLKLIAPEDSLEENRLTGTETSPKEIVAEPMDRAAMRRFDIQAGSGPRKKGCADPLMQILAAQASRKGC